MPFRSPGAAGINERPESPRPTYADIAEDGVLGPRTLETLRRQLATVYGGRPDNARRILLNRYTVERGVIMRNARDREDWPGWWLRLSWV